MDKFWQSILNNGDTTSKVDIHGSATYLDEKDAGELFSHWNRGLRIEKHYLKKKIMYRGTVVLGVTGSGKSTRTVIPALLYPPKNASIIVLDPSLELYKSTAPYYKHGKKYKVLLLDFALDGAHPNSICFNPIDLLDDDNDGTYRRFARVIIQASGMSEGSSDKFWELSAQSLLESLARSIKHQAPEKRNLLSLYELAGFLLSDKELAIEILSSSLDDDIHLQEIMSFLNLGEKIQGSIIATLRAALSPIVNKNLQQITCSRNELDIAQIRKEKTIIYVSAPEKDISEIRFILSLAMSEVFSKLMIMPDKKELDVLLLCDEAGNIGKLEELPAVMTAIRKRRCGVVLYFQDIGQLYSTYGKELGNTIFNNCYTKIVLPGIGYDSAHKISQQLGNSTVEFIDPNSTEAIPRFIQRPLLYPDEITRLPKDHALLLCGAYKPILLKKLIPFYKSFWQTLKLNHYKNKPL